MTMAINEQLVERFNALKDHLDKGWIDGGEYSMSPTETDKLLGELKRCIDEVIQPKTASTDIEEVGKGTFVITEAEEALLGMWQQFAFESKRGHLYTGGLSALENAEYYLRKVRGLIKGNGNLYKNMKYKVAPHLSNKSQLKKEAVEEE